MKKLQSYPYRLGDIFGIEDIHFRVKTIPGGWYEVSAKLTSAIRFELELIGAKIVSVDEDPFYKVYLIDETFCHKLGCTNRGQGRRFCPYHIRSGYAAIFERSVKQK